MIDVTESPEERETRKNIQTKKRIVFLTGLVIVSLAAKVVFKNPPPPKTPDHSDRPFRAIPGILKNLPESERKKLTPQQIAMLEEADRTGGRPDKKKEMLAQKPYTPAEPARDLSQINVKEFKAYEYASKKVTPVERQKPETIDRSKDTLILFARGGHLKVEQAERINGAVRIAFDKTIHASVPRFLVRSVQSNASGWVEPVPRGKSLLKPAQGITIIVAARIAKRITVQKS